MFLCWMQIKDEAGNFRSDNFDQMRATYKIAAADKAPEENGVRFPLPLTLLQEDLPKQPFDPMIQLQVRLALCRSPEMQQPELLQDQKCHPGNTLHMIPSPIRLSIANQACLSYL